MELAAREDIEAPIAAVAAAVTHFETFERAAMRRGADVRRMTEVTPPRAGVAWDAAFSFRGRRRQMRIEVAEFDLPGGMTIVARSAALEGRLLVDLIGLSPTRTRLDLKLHLHPLSMGGRLMLHSMRLARARLLRRFRLRLAEFAMDIEDRHKRRA